MRKELSRPFGQVIGASQLERKIMHDEILYAVGDVTVSTLLQHGFKPKIAVFDYRSERSRRSFPVISKIYPKPIRVVNRRGELSPSLWNAVRRAARSPGPSSIRVYGEEDLAALACIYFAKRDDIVMYGLRRKGMVMIRVNSRIKTYVDRVLLRMTT